MEEEYYQKQRYMRRISELLRTTIRSEFPEWDKNFVIPLLPVKHRQTKNFVDFILPKGVVSRLLTAVNREDSKSDNSKLLESIYSIKKATSSWDVPLRSVDFSNGVIHFKVNVSLLQRKIISGILKKTPTKEKTSQNSFIVCCLPETISQIRTLCLSSSIKNLTDKPDAHSFKYIFVSKSGGLDLPFPLLESLNILSGDVFISEKPVFDVRSLRSTVLKDDYLSKESDDVPYICFNEVTLKKLKCVSCQKMHKAILNTKLKLTENVLECLTAMYHAVSISKHSQPLRFWFIACQSDSIFLSQLKVTLLLLQYVHSDQTKEEKDKTSCSSVCKILSNSLDLIHGPVTTTKPCVPVHQLMSKYSEDIKSSFEAKYGTDRAWLPMVDIIAKSVLKLDLFSVSLTSSVHLDLDSSHGSSVFILYNYSRLSCLLQKFNEGVKNGLYPKLPDTENVDFSLLKEIEERYLIDYLWELGSAPIEYSDIKQQLQYHSFVVFLKKLCKTLSCYYSRHHILGKNLPHLYPIMFARLYLVKAVKCAMLRVLDHLGVTPVDQM
uniref:Uncharacterized protein LOC104266369 n=1 Tax=Phallusia mammillata TaxID=59560 RepID=A0A6F9DIB8_9ASCI|nr:uncharacterized protein LOC104266369 [Phallusia mammillata]